MGSENTASTVITGAPGTGKTSIISHLGDKVSCIPEPARRVLKTAREQGTDATGDREPVAFLDAMRNMMLNDLELAKSLPQPIVFDRSLPDLIAYATWYERVGGISLPDHLSPENLAALCRQEMPTVSVFHCPVWDEIYSQDDERRMTLSEARQFDSMIGDAYEQRLGIVPVLVPKGAPQKRADFIAKAMAL